MNSHYVKSFQCTQAGTYFHRMPNSSPEELWNNISQEASVAMQNSLISKLFELGHPAAAKVKELQQSFMRSVGLAK